MCEVVESVEYEKSEGRSCVLVYIWSPGFFRSVSECLVKCSNCGFLSGARLSGSLPCLHSLNAPLSQSFAGVWLRHKNTQDLGTGFSSDLLFSVWSFFFLFFPVIESRDFLFFFYYYFFFPFSKDNPCDVL